MFTGRPRRNPIQVADQFREQSRDPSTPTYTLLAKHFGVSAAMVSYHMALLDRLPPEFVTWLRSCEYPEALRLCSERRLRPITRLKDERAKVVALRPIRRAAEAAVAKDGR